MSEITPILTRSLYDQGLRVVHEQARRNRVGDLYSEEDWGRLNEEVLESGIVIGTDAIIRGLASGVTHALHLRVYGEGSNAGGANPRGLLTDIRVYATEGVYGDEEVDQARYTWHEGMGTLRGLLTFRADGSVDADFAHGTGPSTNHEAQQRLLEIVSVFGLPGSVIGPANADQYFDYDDEAMFRLVNNLPYVQDL